MAVPALYNNTPGVGSISWDGFNIRYAGQSFSVPAGYSANKFVWWQFNKGADAEPGVRTQLMLNSEMRVASTGWASTVAAYTGSRQAEGDGSFRWRATPIVAAPTTGQYALQMSTSTTHGPWTAGDHAFIRIQARMAPGKTRTFRFLPRYYLSNVAGAFIAAPATVDVTLNDTWQEIYMDCGTMPAATVADGISLWVREPTVAGGWALDGTDYVEFRKPVLASGPDWGPDSSFGGSTTDTADWDYAWTGTVNASPSTATPKVPWMPTLNAADTLPTTLTGDDLLLFLNKNGTAVGAQTTQVIDGSLIVSQSILADALSANSVTGEKILAGTVSAVHIAAGSIGTNLLEALAVTADKIAANTITGDKIAANTIDAQRLQANTITSNEIQAGAITGELLSGDIVLGSKITTGDIDQDEDSPTYGQVVGQRVELDHAGMRLVDALGQNLVNLPTDPGQANFFRGAVQTTSLRVLGGTSIESLGNEIAKGASIILAKGVAAPVQSPTLAVSYDTIRFDTSTKLTASSTVFGPNLGNFAFNPANATAFTYDTNSNTWIIAHTVPGGARVSRFNLDGSHYMVDTGGGVMKPHADDFSDWVISGLVQKPGAFSASILGRVGGVWYLIGQPPGEAVTGYFNKFTSSNTAQWPTLSYDAGADRYIIAETVASTDKIRMRRAAVNTGPIGTNATISSTTELAAATGRSGSLTAGLFGQFDFGTNKYVWSASGSYSTVWVAPGVAGATSTAADNFLTPQSGMKGLVWDGANFWSLGPDGTCYKHHSWTWTDSNAYIHAAVSNYDSDAGGTGTHETGLGAKSYLLRRKRAKLSVTIPGVPDKGGTDDPDRYRLYTALATTSAPPADSAFKLQQTGVNALDPSLPTTLVLTGTNESGAANVPVPFPGVDPARFYSAGTDANGAIIDLLGDGSGRMGPLKWDSAGKDLAPRIRAKRTTDSAAIASASGLTTKIAFPDLDYNVGFAAPTESGAAFTIPSAGLYDIIVNLPWSGSTAGRRGCVLTVNASTTPAGGDASVIGGSNISATNAGGAPNQIDIRGRPFAGGEVLRVWVGQNSGSSLTIDAVNYGIPEITIVKVGPTP